MCVSVCVRAQTYGVSSQTVRLSSKFSFPPSSQITHIWPHSCPSLQGECAYTHAHAQAHTHTPENVCFHYLMTTGVIWTRYSNLRSVGLWATLKSTGIAQCVFLWLCVCEGEREGEREKGPSVNYTGRDRNGLHHLLKDMHL